MNNLHAYLYFSSFRQERERIRSWVNKEIHKPPAPKAGPQSNSTTTPNALSPAPSSGSTAQGEQKKSPVLARKLTKQRTSEPVLVSPQRTQPSQSSQSGQSGQFGQLQAPLQPERVGQPAAPANATNTNGRLSVYDYYSEYAICAI